MLLRQNLHQREHADEVSFIHTIVHTSITRNALMAHHVEGGTHGH